MIYTGYFYIAVNKECIKLTYAYMRSSIKESLDKYLNASQVSNYYHSHNKYFKNKHSNRHKLVKILKEMKQKFDDLIIQKYGEGFRLDSKDTFSLIHHDELDDLIEEFCISNNYTYENKHNSESNQDDEPSDEDSSSNQDDPNNEQSLSSSIMIK
jgi:hypothetical protein